MNPTDSVEQRETLQREAAQNIATAILSGTITEPDQIIELFESLHPQHKEQKELRNQLNNQLTTYVTKIKELLDITNVDDYEIYKLIDELTFLYILYTEQEDESDPSNYYWNYNLTPERWYETSIKGKNISIREAVEELAVFLQNWHKEKEKPDISKALDQCPASKEYLMRFNNPQQIEDAIISLLNFYNRMRSFFTEEQLFKLYENLETICEIGISFRTKIDEIQKSDKTYPSLIGLTPDSQPTPTHTVFAIFNSQLPENSKTSLLQRISEGNFGELFASWTNQQQTEIIEVIEQGQESLFSPHFPETGYTMPYENNLYPNDQNMNPLAFNFVLNKFNRFNTLHPNTEANLQTLLESNENHYFSPEPPPSLDRMTSRNNSPIEIVKIFKDGEKIVVHARLAA